MPRQPTLSINMWVTGQPTVEAKPPASVRNVIGWRAAAPKMRPRVAKAGSYSDAAIATPSTIQTAEVSGRMSGIDQPDHAERADQRAGTASRVAAETIDQDSRRGGDTRPADNSASEKPAHRE